MKRILTITIALLTIIILTGCNTQEEITIIEDSPYLIKHVMTYDEYMNTVTYITVYVSESYDTSALETGVKALLEKEHNTFNAQTDDSELGKVNLNAYDHPVSVSDELFSVVAQALHFSDISDGKYDPTIGPLADLWNITSDSWFAGGVVPSDADIKTALSFVDYTAVVLDESTKSISYTKEGIKLDLGGIAKGYISEQLTNYLISQGVEHAIINVGSSSQLTIGSRCIEYEATAESVTYIATSEEWKIGTADPYDMFGFKAPIGVFRMQDLGLSSSGSAQQFFELDGVRYHHIFDPETGYPVDNELIVVQVLTPDLVGIDALSTLIYIMGLEKGMEYVESRDDLEALFVTYDYKVYPSSGFPEYEITSSEYNFG